MVQTKISASKIKAIHCNTQDHAFHVHTDIEQIDQIRAEPDSLLWLDLQNPTESELAKIEKVFQLHPLAIEDATREHQRPKVEAYDNFYFMVCYTAHVNEYTHEMKGSVVGVFIGKVYMITVHHHPAADLHEVEQRWTRNQEQTVVGIGSLLYAFLDTIVDGYFPLVDRLVDEAEDIEDSMFAGSARERALSLKILTLKKEFLTLRRIITPERDVLNVLTNRDSPVLHESSMIYFRDVYDHITRLAETIDLYRDQLSSIMDTNLSITSNELNKVMRTMTAASIILMVDALISGIYGMNFTNMPELHLEYGYYGALALMAVITIALIIYFRVRKWL